MKLEVPLGAGARACGCRGCGRVFTSLSAFDRHQRWADGEVVCVDPASAGLDRKANGQWGGQASAEMPFPAVATSPRTANSPIQVPNLGSLPSAA